MHNPLKNKKKIELLFRLGEKKSSELLECRCLSSSENTGELRFVVVAPIKNFPRAVDRNKINRRLRAVVHKKTSLLEGSGFNWFLFIYLKKEIVSSEAIEDAFASLFSSL